MLVLFVLLVFLLPLVASVVAVDEDAPGERRLEGDHHRKCYDCFPHGPWTCGRRGRFRLREPSSIGVGAIANHPHRGPGRSGGGPRR